MTKSIIERAGLQGYAVKGKNYHTLLEKELQDAYVYTIDGGHSIIAVLVNMFNSDIPIEHNLVPVPVKTVLRNGYTMRGGYVWTYCEYSREYGLIVPDEDTEM